MAKLGVTPTHKTVDDLKSTILSPSLVPYFEVQFPVPPFLQGLRGGDSDPNKHLTLLCTEAVLPGNNLITFNVDNDYTGVTEKMPHRKVYDQNLQLTFYVNFMFYVILFRNPLLVSPNRVPIRVPSGNSVF